MEKSDPKYTAYLEILKEELIPAMGCTEPISIAYAAAKAREVLGCQPDSIVVEASDNIIKNTKSVTVPNSGNLKGIEASAVVGVIAGVADKKLEVISNVDDNARQQTKQFLETREVVVKRLQSGRIFDLIVTVYKGEEKAAVQISNFHTNIVSIKKNETLTFQNENCDELNPVQLTDRSLLNVESILDFAESVALEEVRDLIQRQIEYNSKIAAEGLSGNWGANIGHVLLETRGADDIATRAKATAAAGADARMSGCDLPVVIVSGSGNQGITASVPVIEFARELEVDDETLIRALVVSDLITIHQKTGIGRLSAYCGAIIAGVGAGAGISWLYGGRFEEVAHTIVNGLAMASGIICDGAKPSCAAKVALAIDAGILGCQMYQKGQEFYEGEGIVTKGVENTIRNIGRLGREGMRETDKEIIDMMINSNQSKPSGNSEA